MKGGTTSREGKEHTEAGLWETLTRRCCIVPLLGEDVVKSWYGVKGGASFEG